MNKFNLIFISLLLTSCSNLINPRIIEEKEVKENATRALNISDNDTLYSKSLRCFAKKIRYLIEIGVIESRAAERLKTVLFSVDDIYDKTGKLYPEGSTAISDIVLSSLNKMSIFKVYDYDHTIRSSKVNYINNNYPDIKEKGNRDAVKSISIQGNFFNYPIGVLKPADFIISGALTQYDTIKSNSIDVDIDIAGYSRKYDIIDVGIDLRIASANTGTIIIDTDEGLNTPSVTLKNRLIISKSDDIGFFKVIHSKKFGVDFSYSVSDPKYYALRELIELGVLELISKLISMPWKQDCSVEKMYPTNNRELK